MPMFVLYKNAIYLLFYTSAKPNSQEKLLEFRYYLINMASKDVLCSIYTPKMPTYFPKYFIYN